MLLPGHLLTSDWCVAMIRASTKSEVPQVALQDDRKDDTDGHSDWEQNLPEFLQESIQAGKLETGIVIIIFQCFLLCQYAFGSVICSLPFTHVEMYT